MYRDEERRHDAAAGAAGDYVGFLRGCDIRLEISPDAGAGVYARDLSVAWAQSDVVAVNSDGLDLPMKPAAEVLRLEPAAR